MGRAGFGVAAGCAAATCAIAAVMVARRAAARARWRRAVALLREFEEGCATPAALLRQVGDAMVIEMHAGLASDGGSKLKMLLTFVDALPNGDEEGVYYAIDLGGTNFRVLRVEIAVGSIPVASQKVETHDIPEELMGTSQDLFNFVALTLKNFVEREDGKDAQKPLGFTFSFPVRQNSVSSGSLIRWTKGFSVGDTVGKDVSQCLDEALARCGSNMRVTALVNDTVGTLALGHYYYKDTVAAVIIGTGTNACYIERADAIIKCQGLLTNSGGMVVNMEWGNFWSSHLPRTPYDISLDDETQNRNDQGFEKMISGMYLGEIARLVLQRMAQESDIFGDGAESLSTPFILSTPYLAAIREDDSQDLSEVRRILQEHLKIPNAPLKTRRLVVKICDIVTHRAARLVAAGIVGILKKLGRDGSAGAASSSGRAREQPENTVVAIEGSLYQEYPVFKEYLDEALVEILGEEVARTVTLRVMVDGPGTGAALLAAVNWSNRQQQGGGGGGSI